MKVQRKWLGSVPGAPRLVCRRGFVGSSAVPLTTRKTGGSRPEAERCRAPRWSDTCLTPVRQGLALDGHEPVRRRCVDRLHRPVREPDRERLDGRLAEAEM